MATITTPAPNKRAVSNYLVPVNGGTHCMKFKQDFTTPLNLDWSQAQLDALIFNPSGFFCDNTGGADLIIRVNELDFEITVPANSLLAYQYPAPVGHTLTITGTAEATIIFADMPVIPFLIQY